MPKKSQPLLAFSHIPKSAGTTLNELLQRHFGFRHLSVRYRTPPPVYTPRDLRVDLRTHPFARSLAGHSLKPFVHFGEYESRLRWYTLLREPVARFISHYQHQFNRGIETYQLSFSEWMRVHHRQNWMVRMIAGEEDVEAARQILSEKFQFVGLVEQFDASLLLMRHFLDLGRFDVDYPAPANRAADTAVRQRVMEQLDEYRDEIMANNDLDLRLYTFVQENIWPKQVAAYGEERLKQDLGDVFQRREPSLAARWRRGTYLASHHLIRKPFLWIDRQLGGSVGVTSRSPILSSFDGV